MTKIIVVDDSEASRAELISLLTDNGYECLAAENGRAGVNLVEKNPDAKLVISDINMPVMNGIEMCKEIKAQGLKAPPIVIVSSDDFSKLKEDAKDIGVVAWIIKPIDHEVFLGGIKQIIR